MLNQTPEYRESYLTVREAQVVGLVARGLVNKEIAQQLRLSEGTVKEYMHRIFRTLGVSNRVELAVWWLNTRVKEGAVP